MNAMLNILISLGRKFLTEKFVSRMIVLGLRQLEKSTNNTLIGDITDSVAEALGDPCNDCNIPK